MHSLAVPLAFLRVSFLSMLAYRLRFYTGVLTYLIYVAVYTSIWAAVYQNPSSRAALPEFGDFETLFSYFAIGWLARSFCFNTIDRDLASLVETGHIAARVARPVSLHVQMISAALGQTLFRLVLFSPLIFCALVLFFDLKGVQPLRRRSGEGTFMHEGCHRNRVTTRYGGETDAVPYTWPHGAYRIGRWFRRSTAGNPQLHGVVESRS